MSVLGVLRVYINGGEYFTNGISQVLEQVLNAV
jgi:hypothetical protein